VISISIFWLIKLLIDEVLVRQKFEEFAGLAVLYAGFVACKLVSDYALERIDAAITESIALRARTDFFLHIVSVSPGTLSKFNSGDLLARLTGDCERIEYLVFSGPLAVLSCCVNIVFFFGFLLWLDWKLTLASMLIAPGILATTARLSPRLKRSSKVARAAMSRWLSQAEERLTARPIIRAFQTQAIEGLHSRHWQSRPVALNCGRWLFKRG